MDAGTTPQCWSNHLGIWCIEPMWFAGMVAEYRAGRLPEQPVAAVRDPDRQRYDVEQHVAIVPLMGPITKGPSKFGGASTLETRRAIRHAANNDDVQSILLHIDSPGGHVAGVEDLASDVRTVAQHKPVTAHIDDLGASAAYWIASQAGRITANRMAEVGSIGTMAVLEDSSKRMERLGVSVHVIATGPYKGIGVDGTALSPESLDYLTRRVHAINQHFLAAVQGGRRFTSEQVALVSDGRVHLAETARQLGLIDQVQSLEQSIADLARGTQPGPGPLTPRPPGRALSYYQSRLAVSR